MKILCLYHSNCYDGFGAAWVVRNWAQQHPDVEVEYRGAMTGKSPEDATGFDMLFLLDFTYSPEILEAYYMQGLKQILVIDHHQTNQDKLGDLIRGSQFKSQPYDILNSRGKWAIFDMAKSGAGLTWDVFHPGKERPLLIDYIEDRDIWNWKLNCSSEVNTAIMSYDLTFENFDLLNHKFNNDRLSLYIDGLALTRKLKKDVRDLLSIKQIFKIGGYEVPVANVPWMLNSDLGNELSKGQPFAATYFDGHTHTVVSLRSQKDGGLDVAKIAESYGGGGHKNASSFRMPLGWRGDK